MSKRRGPVGLQGKRRDAAPESALRLTSREVGRVAGALRAWTAGRGPQGEPHDSDPSLARAPRARGESLGSRFTGGLGSGWMADSGL